MALCKEATISRWNCDSFAELPTEAPEGSTAHIIPTGEKYIMHDGMWTQDLSLIYAFREAGI